MPRIADVHVRSWQAAYRGVLPDDLLDGLSVTEREGSWRALLGGNEHHWLNLVTEDESGVLAGFCSVTTPSRDAKEDESLAEVGALYVDPDRWQEGAGSAMLIAAFEELKERGWREVVLWVLPENHRALAFYAHFGFEIEAGVEKCEERSGRPVIRLRARVNGWKRGRVKGLAGMKDGLLREVSKPWGSELWFAHTERYAGKILRVRAGTRLSIQYHEEKDETSFVLSGRVIVSQGDSAEGMTARELGPGESWRNRPLVVHTLEAVEDAEIVEVSTPQLEDVVRLEDRYGRTADAEPLKAETGGDDSP